jgi:endonuclease G
MIKITILSLTLLANVYAYSLTSAYNDIRSIGSSDVSVKQVGLEPYMTKSLCSQVIDKQVFKICYDYPHRSAKYVGYTLYGDKVNAVNIDERDKFYTESNLPAAYRTKTADYSHTGYDRGHMANDADFDYDPDALVKTYSMANIVPQSPHLNQKTWIKAEKKERDMAVKYGQVTVVNKVVYPQKDILIGKNTNLFVPSGFYKMIFNSQLNYKECFYYENEMPLMLNGFQRMNDKNIGMINETIDVVNDKLSDHIVSCSGF